VKAHPFAVACLAGFLICAVFAGAAVFAGEVVVLTSFPKELFETYKTAFEDAHPGVTVVVKSKQTSAIVAYVRETRSRPDADLVWASATDAFAVLKEDGLLTAHTLPDEVGRRIPAKIGPYPIHDLDGYYFGFALSGYGMMWNTRYLQAYKLKAPAEWTDLTHPMYHGHLSMSAPSRSGTTHLMVESILQGYGWDRGWAVMMNLCGNMATITERSFGVPQGVNNGEFGIGLVIDFFGLSAMASGLPVDFVYPPTTPITPAGIGLVKGGPNPENARAFIHFLLSDAGQRLLFKPQISRLPVAPALYDQAPEGFPNPFRMAMSGGAFDIGVSENRYGLINSLFDQAITFRLQGLKAAWGAVHEAEAALEKARAGGRDVGKAEGMIAEARKLVTTVPIDEAKANDPAFNANFKKESTQVQAHYETEWDAATKANYEQARRLALQAMEM